MDTSLDGQSMPHNLVTYMDPRETALTIEELIVDPEKALAENAIWFFLTNPTWQPKDRMRLQAMFKRKGWNMFIWKYYRVGRCYLGGYKALSACLKLRSL